MMCSSMFLSLLLIAVCCSVITAFRLPHKMTSLQLRPHSIQEVQQGRVLSKQYLAPSKEIGDFVKVIETKIGRSVKLFDASSQKLFVDAAMDIATKDKNALRSLLSRTISDYKSNLYRGFSLTSGIGLFALQATVGAVLMLCYQVWTNWDRLEALEEQEQEEEEEGDERETLSYSPSVRSAVTPAAAKIESMSSHSHSGSSSSSSSSSSMNSSEFDALIQSRLLPNTQERRQRILAGAKIFDFASSGTPSSHGIAAAAVSTSLFQGPAEDLVGESDGKYYESVKQLAREVRATLESKFAEHIPEGGRFYIVTKLVEQLSVLVDEVSRRKAMEEVKAHLNDKTFWTTFLNKIARYEDELGKFEAAANSEYGRRVNKLLTQLNTILSSKRVGESDTKLILYKVKSDLMSVSGGETEREVALREAEDKLHGSLHYFVQLLEDVIDKQHHHHQQQQLLQQSQHRSNSNSIGGVKVSDGVAVTASAVKSKTAVNNNNNNNDNNYDAEDSVGHKQIIEELVSDKQQQQHQQQQSTNTKLRKSTN